MQREVTPQTYQPTGTPGVYRRAQRYVVRWNEDGRTVWRSFGTFDAAIAFKRDFVVPYREKRALPPTAIMPPSRKEGFVYFFQSSGPDAFVKIGWTQDPATRLAKLSTGTPDNLHLIALLPGTRSLERKIQRRLGDYRVGREWFSREVVQALGDLITEA